MLGERLAFIGMLFQRVQYYRARNADCWFLNPLRKASTSRAFLKNSNRIKLFSNMLQEVRVPACYAAAYVTLHIETGCQRGRYFGAGAASAFHIFLRNFKPTSTADYATTVLESPRSLQKEQDG
jgi:hypothetical protein